MLPSFDMHVNSLCLSMFNLCADCDYGELSDNVEHDVQSAPSPAAHYQDEDRLEQDNRVQNRR